MFIKFCRKNLRVELKVFEDINVNNTCRRFEEGEISESSEISTEFDWSNARQGALVGERFKKSTFKVLPTIIQRMPIFSLILNHYEMLLLRIRSLSYYWRQLGLSLWIQTCFIIQQYCRSSFIDRIPLFCAPKLWSWNSCKGSARDNAERLVSSHSRSKEFWKLKLKSKTNNLKIFKKAKKGQKGILSD